MSAIASATRDAIDALDSLSVRGGDAHCMECFVVSLRSRLDKLKRMPECGRLRLAADLLMQSLNVVEAELKAARLALLESLQEGGAP